jgi:hypothetical protein
MAIEKIYKELRKHMDKCLEEVLQQIRSEEDKGYLKIVKWENDCYEYTVGLAKVVIKPSINVKEKEVKFKTYKLEVVEEDYGKWKLTLLDTLSIKGDIHGNFCFLEGKTEEMHGREIEVNIIQEFGEQYIYQVKKYC